MVEQLICNQLVGGSSPFAGSYGPSESKRFAVRACDFGGSGIAQGVFGFERFWNDREFAGLIGKTVQFLERFSDNWNFQYGLMEEGGLPSFVRLL